jgi:hypothetical protein
MHRLRHAQPEAAEVNEYGTDGDAHGVEQQVRRRLSGGAHDGCLVDEQSG